MSEWANFGERCPLLHSEELVGNLLSGLNQPKRVLQTYSRAVNQPHIAVKCPLKSSLRNIVKEYDPVSKLIAHYLSVETQIVFTI